MNATWTSARAAVSVHRVSMVGSALVVACSAALLTATGAWLEVGVRGAGDLAGSMLLAVASSFAGTAVLIALLVVSSTFTVALRPRAREFALLRAVGATVGQVRRLVAAEVLVVAAVAAPLGVVLGLLLAPRLTGTLAAAGVVPAGFTMALSPWPALATLALLVPTALGAARLAGRESARLDPAGAVRASAVEAAALSRGRARTAVTLAVVGLAVAIAPFVAPGTLGAAGSSLGAVVLVLAAALAGPVLVRWAAQRALATAGSRVGAVGALALANAHGFSRRLTGAIVPLALLLALGTVQSGASSAMADAAETQVREGITADLVVQGGEGGGVQASVVAALPGVVSTGVTTVIPATVQIDQEDEDVPVLGALAWEAAALRTVPLQGGYLDPGVVSGSLVDLAGERAIAVSRDAALGVAGVGDPVDVRVDGVETQYTIVALYERGLGLGDYLVGAVPPGASVADSDPTLLVQVARDADRVRAAIAATGLAVTDVEGYAQEVRADADRRQDLSTWLLLALLALVAVMAANTLVMVTRSRREELGLLRRTGATRRQLMGMVVIESSLTTLTAVVVGLACALPALVGVGQGLLGVPVPVVDPAVTGALVGVVVLIGMVVPTAAVLGATTRSRWSQTSRAR
ncbi:FtsX-like permease family protein [Xylanimonas protaetiae]|uniref:ABC transporter permease n=1 Tax=Xylanimonas protaetiae TaxID=2509457 RepID=A0A4P6F7H1_9MICO|nr:ABC transporter permease [Xylanimonas protaetiae]QAY71396.1 ABC transporter permease [Xylanimonas protaetiae]